MRSRAMCVSEVSPGSVTMCVGIMVGRAMIACHSAFMRDSIRTESNDAQGKHVDRAQDASLSSSVAYSNPPSILDSMSNDKPSSDGEASTSSTKLPVIIGGLLLAVLLIAGALGLDQGGSSDSSTSRAKVHKSIRSAHACFWASTILHECPSFL
jgi:hypothetical protein